MTFSPEFLLDKYFETAFSAPDGIKRLRELILSLAMQGKLVPQDPNDQPARELLQEIEAEKQRLIKAGKIKKQKPLPLIQPEEIPYNLPESWEWVRLGNLLLDSMTGIDKGKQFQSISNLYPYFKMNNISFFGNCDFSLITRVNLSEEEKNKFLLNNGDFLFNTRNSRELVGKACIFQNPNGEQWVFNNNILRINLPKKINNNFANFWFLSCLGKYELDKLKSATTNVSAIYQNKLFTLPIPLPPLAEQKRIVEKIDSLMAQCDELEKRQQEREQKRILVHTSAVQKLLNAPEEKTFGEAWQFIQQNFGELYAVKENVSELRKAILQLAVMGKLVPQDPHDPPASELLKEIEAEKQRLIKEGKIKKQKPLPEITADEIPYDLPDSWEWCILRQISLAIDYGTSQKTCNDSSKIPVYRMGNILNGRLIDINLKYIDPNIDDLPRLFLQKDDILFNRTNSYELVGKSALYNGEDNIKTFASYLIRIRLEQKNVFPRFVNLVMNAPYFRKTQIEPEITQQCGQANFNGTKLSETLIPLPPLSEQHRIVAKVDALMTLCDQLENQIDQQTTKQTQLLSAVMAGV